MNNKPQVLLARAHWCHYCIDFMPIFEKAIMDHSDKYEFKNYDFADDGIMPNKDSFANDHSELVDKIEGYPTVFLKIKKDNKILNSTVNTTRIINNDINKAVNEFIANIDKEYKTLSSDSKKEYFGGDLSSDNFYKNKYMKYKEKYYKLKNG